MKMAMSLPEYVGNRKGVSGQSLTVLHHGFDPDKQCQSPMEFNASSRIGLLCNQI